MKTEHKLYDNEITVVFDSEARQNRYIVTDGDKVNTPVPGVTSVLDLALNKKGLMTFPLNAALSHLGARFSEEQHKWVLDHEIRLTEALVGSAAKAWTVRADSGKDTGTEVHSAIENFLNGGKYTELSPEADKAFDAFRNWYVTHDIKPLAIEQIVYSRAHQYAGTFDCLLEIDGKTVLCDLKTTNVSRYGLKVDGNWTGIYPEAFLQLGAYSLAHREEENGGDLSQDGTISDLMVINITKTGQCYTLRASELGLSVSDCESNFIKARDLVNFVSRMGKK